MSQRYKPTVSIAALRGDPQAVFVTKRNEEADLQQKGLTWRGGDDGVGQ